MIIKGSSIILDYTQFLVKYVYLLNNDLISENYYIYNSAFYKDLINTDYTLLIKEGLYFFNNINVDDIFNRINEHIKTITPSMYFSFSIFIYKVLSTDLQKIIFINKLLNSHNKICFAVINIETSTENIDIFYESIELNLINEQNVHNFLLYVVYKNII